MLGRRRLLLAAAGTSVAVPLNAAAQSGKVYRVGYLSLAPPNLDKGWRDAFREGLRELGYIEGENLAIVERHASGQIDRMPPLAAELARLGVDVLVVYGAWLMAGKLPSGVPVVMTVHADPVGSGMVQSLARPGGNITGLSDTHSDLVPKRLELLKEVVPSASRVAVLFNPNSLIGVSQLKDAEAAAPALGLQVFAAKADRPREMDRVFARFANQRPDGLLVIGEPTIGAHRPWLAQLALKYRLPAISTVRQWAEVGFLMSYGANFSDLWRRAALYVHKIIRGAKPADLPIEQPTKFELVVNLKTAKAIGVAMPRSILLRADELIE